MVNSISNPVIEDKNIHMADEIYNISLLCLSSYDCFYDVELPSDTKIQLLDQAGTAFNNSAFMPPVAGNIVSLSAKHISEDGEIFGHHIKEPKGRVKDIYTEILNILIEWDSDSAKEDFASFIDFVKLMATKDLLNGITDEKLLSALSDQGFTEQLFIILFENDDMKKLIPHFAYAGIGSVCDEAGIKLPKDFTLEFNLDDYSKNDIIREADILSDIISTLSEIKKENGNCNLESMNVNQLIKLTKAIIKLKDSRLLKELVPQLLVQITKQLDYKQIASDLLDDTITSGINDISDYINQFFINDKDKTPNEETNINDLINLELFQ